MSSHLQIYMISQVSERKASTDGVRKASSKPDEAGAVRKILLH